MNIICLIFKYAILWKAIFTVVILFTSRGNWILVEPILSKCSTPNTALIHTGLTYLSPWLIPRHSLAGHYHQAV
jgi:hypothetical protein